ncbi:MAG TPA: HAD-IA family hydrolase [Candidatus Saccharimonadales bacterium]|nr:HAD-IA family hydrolase [Candidatus Saccharimonadales bacterium]
MIKAIIFDCFGVLVTESWLAFKEEHFGHDKALSQEAADLMQQADAGLISHEDFVGQVADMAGMSSAEVNSILDRNVPNATLFDFIEKELKPHYKVGMLSNAAADWLEELFSKQQLGLFDAIALSYESGIAKPDERAYYQIAEKLGVEPEECVFVDDQERHCTGAQDAGMRAVLYTSVKDLKRQLQVLTQQEQG